jgi:hypothetical protein
VAEPPDSGCDLACALAEPEKEATELAELWEPYDITTSLILETRNYSLRFISRAQALEA